MAIKDFDKKLEKFAELIVRVGINLQPGQKLFVNGKNFNRGVSLDAAPLMQLITRHAYKAGAKLVDILWEDPNSTVERLKYAPKDSLDEYPSWRTRAMAEYVTEGNALLTIYAEDPDRYKKFDAETVYSLQRKMEENIKPAMEQLMLNTFNWSLIALPVPGWAKKLYPKLSEKKAVEKLWEKIFELCRLDRKDPVKAWEEHIGNLHARSAYLTDKNYSALKYKGPGTDLTLGLPKGHLWESARIKSTRGVSYVANLPTEEVFSMPDKNRTEGVVTATLPLSHAGTIIEGFSLTFKNGSVVDFKAKKGGKILEELLNTDEGARRLGEVALVPNSSPIAQSNMMFYNTLFDENAASHLALGRAYRSTMKGGETMTAEEFAAAGGNDSMAHEDFMIGSSKLDIDGISQSGKSEPVMRKGEWAFKI
jgi:aminopeptidase